MQSSYDITGAEVIQRDYPVYSSGAIAKGALMMMGTTDPDSAADQGLCLVPAYNATPANTAIDAVGAINEAVAAASMTASPAAAGNDFCYAKVVINPAALYNVEISQATPITITSTSSTTLTVPSLQDDIDGYWVYFVGTQTGVKGSLRYLEASASGSATMDSALTVNGDNTDTVIIFPPELKYANNLTSDSVDMHGLADAQSGATNLRILQVYIDRGNGIEVLKKGVHAGLNNLDTSRHGAGPKFYADIIMKDCLFGVQE